MNNNQYNINNPNYKHGGSYTKLYNVWKSLKKRCLNPYGDDYKYYGGRGITICDEWLEFIPFRDWALSNDYKEGLTIDRKENDGNYTPENCQWITNKENSRKRSWNKINLEIANEIRNLYATNNYTHKQLAEIYNVCRRTIEHIINNKIWKI